MRERPVQDVMKVCSVAQLSRVSERCPPRGNVHQMHEAYGEMWQNGTSRKILETAATDRRER